MAESMGFPTWTLWGMGAAAFGALIAITLAFLAQSPRLLARLNLTGQRLDLRAKSYTGYGLALLLLAMGFFLAGVPLNRGEGTASTETPAVAGSEATGSAADESPALLDEASTEAGGQSGAMVGLPTPTPGGASGAMAGLITPQPTLESGEVISGTAEIALPPGAESSPQAVVAAETTTQPTATPTLFPTATPSPTPSPTLSPTPILVPTARVNDGTSTLPVRRLPGGVVLVVLVRGDTVIPLPGHAFHSGDAWREIQTVDGVIGWVPEQFLEYEAN